MGINILLRFAYGLPLGLAFSMIFENKFIGFLLGFFAGFNMSQAIITALKEEDEQENQDSSDRKIK